VHLAWHEAGHAFVAHLLGGRVREVTIESESDVNEAHVSVEWPAASAHERALCEAQVALAGPVAELVYRGEEVLDDPATFEAWRGDWDCAARYLSQIHATVEELDEARQQILVDIQALLVDPENHERLARLADTLDAHGTLDESLLADVLP